MLWSTLRFSVSVAGSGGDPGSGGESDSRPLYRCAVSPSVNGPIPRVDLTRPSELPERSELPDPLVTFDGKRVGTAEEWRDVRRPELKQLFQHYVYGYLPSRSPISVDVENRGEVVNGRGTLYEIAIAFGEFPSDAPTIDLLHVVPAGADTAPVFLAVNRRGNHAVATDDSITITDSGDRFGVDRRGSYRDGWCLDRLLDRGYGFATFHHADVDPDRDDFTEGIHPYCEECPGTAATRPGTLAAWAWGIHHAVTYLERADRVRDDAIAVTGHSRRGKAALLAGALDDRIDLVAPHQSGTGGGALSRDNSQETVAAINEAFPHWFNDLFPAFAGRPVRLPVDQHQLLALVAPRPLIDTEGARDYWANPGRAYDAVRAAAPVYDVLDSRGLVGDGLLYGDAEITPDTAGSLLQYRRETGHTLDSGYWSAILDFADVHFR